jgi:hypothetical protein
MYVACDLRRCINIGRKPQVFGARIVSLEMAISQILDLQVATASMCEPMATLVIFDMKGTGIF